MKPLLFMICCISLSHSGCVGLKELESKLKDAEHEREILRDAYEAQQMRLKELESRLLRMEDRGQSNQYDLGQTTRDQHQLNQRQTSNLKNLTSNSYKRRPHDRLKALPVVMVKRNLESNEREGLQKSVDNNEEVRSIKKRESSQRIRSRKVGSESKKKRFQSSTRTQEEQTIASLSHDNLHEYHDPDQAPPIKYDEQKVERESLISPKEQTHTSFNSSNEFRPERAVQDRGQQVQDRGQQVQDRGQQVQDRGQQVQDRGQQVQAEAVSTSVTSLNQKEESSEQTILNSALKLRAQGQLDKSMKLAKRLISESPTNPLVPDALYLMGRLQIEKGQESLGRSTLLRLSRLYPQAKAAQEARQFLKLEGS